MEDVRRQLMGILGLINKGDGERAVELIRGIDIDVLNNTVLIHNENLLFNIISGRTEGNAHIMAAECLLSLEGINLSLERFIPETFEEKKGPYFYNYKHMMSFAHYFVICRRSDKPWRRILMAALVISDGEISTKLQEEYTRRKWDVTKASELCKLSAIHGKGNMHDVSVVQGIIHEYEKDKTAFREKYKEYTEKFLSYNRAKYKLSVPEESNEKTLEELKESYEQAFEKLEIPHERSINGLREETFEEKPKEDCKKPEKLNSMSVRGHSSTRITMGELLNRSELL